MAFKPDQNKIFMIDIETTGVDPKTEHVMQIAMIEMTWENGQWSMGRTFNFFQHTSLQPTTKFHMDHMREIFQKCQAAPLIPAPEVRQKILDFCKQCGSEPPNIFFAGWNAGIFDIPFLEYHGYIQPARYVNDKLTGDCHYRVYDLSGALQMAANVKGHNEINAMIKEAQKIAPKHTYEGSRHDALYDCERQIHLLNGLIKLLRP
jgi:oligoribonuclease (3'-5' exoribonuclease)